MLTRIPDYQLPTTLEIPAEFKAAHYTPQEVLELLGFDQQFGETAEWEFWQAYKSGYIPPGVWLPTNKPLVVWERAFIDQWIKAGSPPMENVVAHERRVYAALLQTVEDNLPARPATLTEAN